MSKAKQNKTKKHPARQQFVFIQSPEGILSIHRLKDEIQS